mgnify:CR=1 FL=1
MKSSEPKPEATEKRPYRPPRILSRESLEAVAVVCTDASAKADPYACPSGPLNS